MSWQRRAISFFPAFVLSVAFDQWTKVVATAELRGHPTQSFLGDVFRLGLATNDGAFLSLGASLPPQLRSALLIGAVGLLLLGISVYALVSPKHTSVQVIGYSLIASGGFSNWVDRARFGGSVVDFMNLGLGPLRTGVFNVADLAILAGIGVLLWAGRHDGKTPPATPPGVDQGTAA